MSVCIHRPKKSQFMALLKQTATDGIPWVLDTETNGLEVRGPIAPHRAYWIGLEPEGSKHVFILTREEFDSWGLRPLVEDLTLIGHNLRFDLHALDLQPKQPWVDTLTASYFPHTTGKHAMDHIAKVRGWPKIPTPELLKQGRIHEIPEEEIADYLSDDCRITSKMFKALQISRANDDYKVEQAVYAMERRGMRLLFDRLLSVRGTLIEKIALSEVPLRHAGMVGNLNSPTQVGQWLVGMGRRLPTSKTGSPSTSKLVLQQLSDNGDDLAQKLLDWRQLVKLQTSFIEPLPKLVQEGILYPNTGTTRTATGRFACSAPNLQQIPKRGPLGRAIRGCLTSRDQNGVTACDFSQVELRVAASFADESVLLEAFATGRCPHTEVAAKMLGKQYSEITEHERFKAKAVNFGILNGMGFKRLSLELKTDHKEARGFLHDYKRNLPKLHSWMEQVWREAETHRVARTVAGRTRIFRGSESTRPAISVIVQGSAAELMRKSLVLAEEWGLNPILSMHDELLIGGKDRGEELRDAMECAANTAYSSTFSNVRFTASATHGETWGDV